MNEEATEILKYLESRKGDYVIWAGFAQFAYLGLETSPDIDIYVSSKEAFEMIYSTFLRKSWRVKSQSVRKGRQVKIITLEKMGFTFDILYSKPASELFFKDMVEIKVYGYRVCFVSKEALFLTKLGQLTAANRADNKRKRDLETIIRLREQINAKKTKDLASKLPDSYWKMGWI